MSRKNVLLAVALGHFAIDTLSGLAPVFVAFMSIPLALSNSQVGLAAVLYSASGSLSQPLFGHLADRYGGRWLGTLGLIWLVFWLGLSAFASGYPQLAACLAAAGLGSGAFHPQGAMNAFLVSGSRRGGSLSIWSVGGATGYSLGPALAGLLFGIVGQRGVLYLSLAVLPVAYVLARYLPKANAFASQSLSPTASGHSAPVNPRAGNSSRRRLPISLWAMIMFLLLIVSRSWAYLGISTYVPKLYAGWGYPPAEYGLLLSAILFAEGVGGLAGGFLSDRIGKRPVISSTLFIAAPAFGLFLLLAPPWNIPLGIAGGLALGASQSLTLLIAQEWMPGRVGLASGLMMGFTFVAGAVGASASGAVADRIGLLPVLHLMAMLPWVAAVCSLFLPREDRCPS